MTCAPIVPRRACAPLALALTVALTGCASAPPGLPRGLSPAAAPRPAAPTTAPATAPTTAPAGTAAAPGPIVVRDNRGGNVLQMMAYRSQLAASGQQVQIRGVCDSACTMLTTLPNACLGPEAQIGFHAPRIPNTQIIPPIVDQLMAATYRNGIRARWYAEWRHSLVIKRITAKEYVTLDPMTRLCPM